MSQAVDRLEAKTQRLHGLAPATIFVNASQHATWLRVGASNMVTFSSSHHTNLDGATRVVSGLR